MAESQTAATTRKSANDINARIFPETGDTLLTHTLKQAVHFASVSKYIDEVEDLLQQGADPNTLLPTKTGYITPLRKCKNLLAHYQQQLDEHPESSSLLFGLVSLYEQECEIIKNFGGVEEVQKDPAGTKQELALVKAAQKGKTQEVQNLLAQGVSPNAADERGTTALMKAAQKGQTAVLTQLLNAGADVDLRNLDGESALLLVAKNKKVNLFEQLLHAGAHDTWRALDEVANTGNTEMVKAFIKAGIDINQCSELDGNGWNVLEKNINKPLAKGNKAAVALVEAGSDVNKDCSGEGKNALYHATITNNKTILNMLKEHGAKLTPRIAQAIQNYYQRK